uniref:Uncharacterized protein n=1 Tax=Arundo donax TaxID=35708 RepID=A0A0A9GTH4_ARUDO
MIVSGLTLFTGTSKRAIYFLTRILHQKSLILVWQSFYLQMYHMLAQELQEHWVTWLLNMPFEDK